MELNEIRKNKLEFCYLWIGDKCIPNIKDQGFNFSVDLEFEFTQNKLSIKHKKQFINNFYGKNIINISAVVGENGSGKTSIINFLKNSEYETGKVSDDEEDNSNIKKEIVIFKKAKKIHIFYTVDLIESEVNNDSDYEIDYHNLSKENFVDEFNKLGRRPTIFYSDAFNSMDESAHQYQEDILYNISTSHLIHAEKNNELTSKINVDQVEKFKILDTFFQLNFLANNNEILQKNEIINPSIKYVRIVMTNARINHTKRDTNYKSISKKCFGLNELINKLEVLSAKLSNSDIKNNCNNYFKISIILELLHETFSILSTRDLIDKFNNGEYLNKKLIEQMINSQKVSFYPLGCAR